MKKSIFRIGIKNFPAAHGGVEAATYNFVQATKDKYDFTIFTVWDNPTVENNVIAGVKVFQLAKGWIARFKQIRAAVVDKKNTVLHFHMEIFIPLAIIFSLLGYNVVSSIHGLSWENPKIGWFVRKLVYFTDILGVNFVKRMIFVSKADYLRMGKYTFRHYYYIPNGSAQCHALDKNPQKDMVFIGRISVHKNLLLLIEAANKYRRQLDIYGPVDERELKYSNEVKRLIRESKYVHYCGVLNPKDIYSVISQYKCAVNVSKAEACPNSVIEAGACGLFLYLSYIDGHKVLNFPDVKYFKWNQIDLSFDSRCLVRSTANVEHHKKNYSIETQIANYTSVYESFS